MARELCFITVFTSFPSYSQLSKRPALLSLRLFLWPVSTTQDKRFAAAIPCHDLNLYHDNDERDELRKRRTALNWVSHAWSTTSLRLHLCLLLLTLQFQALSLNLILAI
uniref:Uncharacterized protein n=1 Tax=Physcomitrium patens TaxID=3218 RepID=A0A2K1IQ46_PHYPA|nr:hypothetical protein PHYPA_025534 [Physcomitrium patens]